MSELLKQVALDAVGLPGCRNTPSNKKFAAGSRCTESGRTGDPDSGLRIQDDTRMNPVAERFWRELRELEIGLADILQRRTTPTAIIPDQINVSGSSSWYSIISRLIASVCCTLLSN